MTNDLSGGWSLLGGTRIGPRFAVRVTGALIFGLLVCGTINTVSAQVIEGPRKQAILKQAIAAYYNLKDHGFVSYESSAHPNWDIVLAAQKKSDPQRAASAINILNAIHFFVKVDSTGSATVTHANDPVPLNDQQKQGFAQIYWGIDQMLAGFWRTATMFLLNAPFPDPDSQFKLEDVNGEYRISYKEGTTDITTTMSKDFVISSSKIVSPDFVSEVRPKFTKSPQGLLLSGYDGDYVGEDDKDTTVLSITIDYQTIDGLQLVSKLKVNSTYQAKKDDPKVPEYSEITFDQYKVIKR